MAQCVVKFASVGLQLETACIGCECSAIATLGRAADKVADERLVLLLRQTRRADRRAAANKRVHQHLVGLVLDFRQAEPESALLVGRPVLNDAGYAQRQVGATWATRKRAHCANARPSWPLRTRRTYET